MSTDTITQLCRPPLCGTLTKVLCQARGTLAGVDHKLMVACEPSQVVHCMYRIYLVNNFVVVCLNLSSSVCAYGSMPVLGVNVCQLITNLSYILNFITASYVTNQLAQMEHLDCIHVLGEVLYTLSMAFMFRINSAKSRGPV